MCRLFAYVAAGSSTVKRELGDDGVEKLTSLARLHGDGWGWAGVSQTGAAPTTVKSPKSALKDPQFNEMLSQPSHAAMIHLRWATMGLPVEICNAHPFSTGELSFEHNGSLKPIAKVREMLSAESRAKMTGVTDSEMYFMLIQEEIGHGLTLPEAVIKAVRRLRSAFPLSSLNAILLDSQQLVVVHASARSTLPEADVEEFKELGGLPDEHNEDYFALRMKRTIDDTILISSTGVDGSGWENLPPESVTTIDLDSRSMHTDFL
ncbi:MAG: class II glutamine amidotransferase [Aurantimicrobium sp.]|uniref:class II glutamine amidotransferase n=1 Tax=Aurantimicrobium sp. TaxID=1930784 RepID=UPI002FCBBEA4